MTCTWLEHRIPRTVWLAVFVLGCIGFVGCSFPKRTFVAEEEPTRRTAVSEVPSRTADAESAPSPTVQGIPAKEKKSFDWSNWLGPFAPQKPESKAVNPPQRIPLPRTDGTRDERWDAAEPNDNAPPAGF